MNELFNWLKAFTNTKFMHGLFMAVGGAVAAALYNAIQNGHLPESWVDFKPILILGLSTGLLYILKNKFGGTGAALPN